MPYVEFYPNVYVVYLLYMQMPYPIKHGISKLN